MPNSHFKAQSIITVLALLFAFTSGVAAQGIVEDISWWRGTVPDNVKVYVVQGMLDAYQSGWLAGVTQESQRFESEGQAYSQPFQTAIHNISFRKLADGDYASYQNAPTFTIPLDFIFRQ